MDTEQLITLFRVQAYDELTGVDDTNSLWKDAELKQYATEAQNEFCREVNEIADMTTASITSITVTADDPWIDLDTRITKIRDAVLQSNGRSMLVTNMREVVEGTYENDYGVTFDAKWEQRAGVPCAIIMDLENGKGRLYPTPTGADTINLKVYRLPLVQDGCTSLEIRPHHHIHIVKALKGWAYEHMDAEVNNPDLATRYRGQWLAYIEKAKKGDKVLKKRPGAVRYGGL